MNNYLVIIENDPELSDEQLLRCLRDYGFKEKRAQATMTMMRIAGVGPGGFCNQETAAIKQSLLEGMGLRSRLALRDQPALSEFGRALRSQPL